MYDLSTSFLFLQCNYSVLLLLYDFVFENVEIKTNLNLKPELELFSSLSGWL